jgi:hypothetical protein
MLQAGEELQMVWLQRAMAFLLVVLGMGLGRV